MILALMSVGFIFIFTVFITYMLCNRFTGPKKLSGKSRMAFVRYPLVGISLVENFCHDLTACFVDFFVSYLF